MSRMANDLLEIGEVAHHGPEDLFIAVMTLIGALCSCLQINVKLALLTFVIVPFLLFIAVYFNQKMTKTFRRMMGDLADINARIEDNIGGIRVVQAFANESHEKKLFEVNNGTVPIDEAASYKIMAWNISLVTC